MKDFVIYTVLTGGYDKIEQPLVVDNRFNYILFSDNTEKDTIGIWQVRSIPYKNSDLTRVSRYPKMHPEELLKEYAAWLYIDANVQITNSKIYDYFMDAYLNNLDWAGVKHPTCNCIYKEAYRVLSLSLEREYPVVQLCCFLRRQRYPRNNGLYENNVIYRRNNKIISEVNNKWWLLYLQYVRRDQLSLQYVLSCYPNMKCGFILPQDESTRGTSSTLHAHQHKTHIKRTVNESVWKHIKNRCRVGLPYMQQHFMNIHYMLYSFHPIAAITGLNLWGIITCVLCGPLIKHRAITNKKSNK